MDILPRQASMSAEERRKRNEREEKARAEEEQLKRLRGQSRRQRRSMLQGASSQPLTPLASLSSSGSGSSLASPAASARLLAGQVSSGGSVHVRLQEAELGRGSSKSDELVERRLASNEQISLISTLLVGTAVGVLTVLDRAKVDEYSCAAAEGGSLSHHCDAHLPFVAHVAVVPMHVTIGLNLFSTLVQVLIAFYTKRTLGWGVGYTAQAEHFFSHTKQLRTVAFGSFCVSLPCFLIALGASAHILLPMGALGNALLGTIYLSTFFAVLIAIAFVMYQHDASFRHGDERIAEKEEQNTRERESIEAEDRVEDDSQARWDLAEHERLRNLLTTSSRESRGSSRLRAVGEHSDRAVTQERRPLLQGDEAKDDGQQGSEASGEQPADSVLERTVSTASSNDEGFEDASGLDAAVEVNKRP